MILPFLVNFSFLIVERKHDYYPSDLKSLFEIKRFERSSFDSWKERMLGILFLKDCEGALLEVKPEDMNDVAWMKLNKKAITSQDGCIR